MELDEFIKASLSSIMKGVSGAVAEHSPEDTAGFINPRDAKTASNFADLTIQDVEFDVAITVESSQSKEGQGNIGIKVIEASLSGSDVQKTVGESRVRFSVPVALPGTKIES